MRFRHRLKNPLCKVFFRRGPAHKFIHLLTLAAFVGTSIGFPMPAETAGKDRSRPFPCQDRVCGCRSAEQCWRGCCCFSMRQKLTWAEEHGVEPPAFVKAAVQQETLASRQQSKPTCQHCTKPGSEQRPTCRMDTVPSKCLSSDPRFLREKAVGRQPVAGQPVAAQPPGEGGVRFQRAIKTQSETDHPLTAPSHARGTTGVTFVIGAVAQGCQGISLLWTTLGGSLPPPEAVVWNFDWRLVAPVAAAPCTYLSTLPLPPVPPPRLAASVS